MICILYLMLHLSQFTHDSLPVSASTRRLGRRARYESANQQVCSLVSAERYSSFVALIIIDD